LEAFVQANPGVAISILYVLIGVLVWVVKQGFHQMKTRFDSQDELLKQVPQHHARLNSLEHFLWGRRHDDYHGRKEKE
jgi:hypothetical protein